MPPRSRLLSLRLTVGKILLTLLGLACGASIGREGPTVQVGASIMLGAAKLGGMGRERGLILAGSAAGVAAAFNTPLAGIVFAIEEMSRAFESRTSGLVLIAVILAGLASLGLVGNYSYFGHSTSMLKVTIDWIAVLVCGVLGGIAGRAVRPRRGARHRADPRWIGVRRCAARCCWRGVRLDRGAMRAVSAAAPPMAPAMKRRAARLKATHWLGASRR